MATEYRIVINDTLGYSRNFRTHDRKTAFRIISKYLHWQYKLALKVQVCFGCNKWETLYF